MKAVIVVLAAIAESCLSNTTANDEGRSQLLAGVGLANRKGGQGSCGS